MAIICSNVVIKGKGGETVRQLTTDEPVVVVISAPPVVKISSNVAVVQHPDFVEKGSDYVSHMFK